MMHISLRIDRTKCLQTLREKQTEIVINLKQYKKIKYVFAENGNDSFTVTVQDITNGPK